MSSAAIRRSRPWLTRIGLSWAWMDTRRDYAGRAGESSRGAKIGQSGQWSGPIADRHRLGAVAQRAVGSALFQVANEDRVRHDRVRRDLVGVDHRSRDVRSLDLALAVFHLDAARLVHGATNLVGLDAVRVDHT